MIFQPGGSSRPYPNFSRMMVFVDGENLVLRFQEMIRKGSIPNVETRHLTDTYVWNNNTTKLDLGFYTILRATYYSYCQGTEDDVKQIISDVKGLTYERADSKATNTLYPCIFKKEKNKKAKGVDIQMTIDILKHTFNNNLDTVYLISGDGDYLPVIEEVIRHGKQVYLASFSDGLNSSLINKVDKYIDLDKVYFN